MEPGFVEAQTNLGRPATFLWIDSTGREVGKLVPAAITIFGKPALLPAFRCQTCGLLEADYGRPVD
jgi:hypothetical protein